MNKHSVSHGGQVIGKRVSANRIYTHAIVCWGHGRTAVVMTWCGRLDLAQKEHSKYQRAGYTAEIMPVDLVQTGRNAPAVTQ